MKAAKNLKLDIFPHIFPLAYFERMKQIAERNPALAAQLQRWMHIPVLWDLERRIKMMKRFPGYKQVLTLSMPAVEFLGDENQTPELARLAKLMLEPQWLTESEAQAFFAEADDLIRGSK